MNNKDFDVLGETSFFTDDIFKEEDNKVIPQNLASDFSFTNNGTFVIIEGFTEEFKLTQPTTANIPSEIEGLPVTTIGTGAFNNNQLTNVTIPNSVTEIGDNAFSYNHLTSITLPNSVTSIGNAAFIYNQLTSITIPDNTTKIGDSAFHGNELKSVTIPNSVTEIDTDAFRYNQLTSVTIPNSVTEIGMEAFYDNPDLTEIIMVGRTDLEGLALGDDWNRDITPTFRP